MEIIRDQSRYILRGPARDQPALGARLHPGLAGRAGLHALVALDIIAAVAIPTSSFAAFGMMWRSLQPSQRDDAGPWC